MAASSEIEKLETRYAENPEGRYFAPLADAYRKAGRVDDALQLVHKGLEKHPDYLSAHIVLGRCQLDKKDDAAARDAFETVLGLDSENIIALKSLAEIAERSGDTAAARGWLQKLLLVDSMNTDAEADLQRLGGPLPGEAPGEGAPAEEAPAAEISFADVTADAEAPTEPVPAIEPEPSEPPPAFTEAPTEPMAGIFLDELEPPAVAPAIDFLDPAPSHEAPTAPVEELAAAGSVWDAAPEVASIDLDSSRPPGAAGVGLDQTAPSVDLNLIMPEDVTPPEEMKRPSSKLVQMVSPQVPAEEAPQHREGGAEPMLTETMADLYLKQGFKSEAADGYRRLLAQRPDDATLRAKLAQVEGPPPSLSAAALGSEAVGAWLRRVAGSSLSAPPPPPPPPAAPLAEDQTPMETAFAAPEPEPAAMGEPARPASDAFSLDQIFGAEPGAGVATAAPPRESQAATPANASFDEFFGAAPEKESVRPKPAEAAPPAEDDVSSFNAWLHGLKR